MNSSDSKKDSYLVHLWQSHVDLIWPKCGPIHVMCGPHMACHTQAISCQTKAVFGPNVGSLSIPICGPNVVCHTWPLLFAKHSQMYAISGPDALCCLGSPIGPSPTQKISAQSDKAFSSYPPETKITLWPVAPPRMIKFRRVSKGTFPYWSLTHTKKIQRNWIRRSRVIVRKRKSHFGGRWRHLG